MSKKAPNSKGTLSDLSSEIFNLIKKIGWEFDNNERKLIRTHSISGVTPPQLFILRILWKEDGFPLKYFAKIGRCARSTITGIIKTMMDNDLVILEPNPKDGRSSLVRLTEKGKELQIYKPPLTRNPTEYFKDFKPKEIDKLNQLLKKLLTSIED